MVGSFLLLALIAWHVDARGGQLSLTWVDTSSDASGFAVERSMEGTGAFAEISRTGPNVTAYTDFPLADATTYCYRVRAFNSVGYSDYSNPACAISTYQSAYSRPHESDRAWWGRAAKTISVRRTSP